MFSEMLTNSEYEIFTEAIDQFFENDPIENNFEEQSINEEDSSQLNNNLEIERETNIESMNVKFCDSLDEVNEIKDISTDIESEDFSTNSEKIPLKITECIFINEENINKMKKKIFDDVYEQIDLIERIKAIFKPKKQETKNFEDKKDIQENKNKNDIKTNEKNM